MMTGEVLSEDAVVTPASRLREGKLMRKKRANDREQRALSIARETSGINVLAA